MGKSQSKLTKYDTPVFCQMRKLYGQRCMGDIKKLIKYHEFPKEGTLSSTRLKTVKLSIQEGSDKPKGCAKKHVCEKCEKTINCWVEEADKRERRMLKKQGVNGEEKASAPSQNDMTNTYVCAFQHETPPSYNLYPDAELQGLKVDPDLDCSPFPPTQPAPITTPCQRQDGARAAEPTERAHAAENFRADETPPPGRRTRLAIRKVKPGKTVPRSYVLRSSTCARDRELETEVEEIPDTPSESEQEEEEEDVDFGNRRARKRKNWDRMVKEEEVSVTCPMIEVLGINGPDLIYRAWNLSDMKEAMAHLPNPDGAGDRFATELTTFCREFSPTLNELKRLLKVKLGGMNWHKVSAALPAGDRRRMHVDWSHATNDGYRAAVTGLADTVREAFPARIDISRVSCCRQEQSGLREPADRGDRPTAWESHLATSLLNGLRSEISQTVKHKNKQTWAEVGEFVKHCVETDDWGEVNETVRYSEKLGVFKWFTKGFTVFAENFCKRCVICNTHNVARGVKMPLASHPPSTEPFEYLMMDYIELSPCEGKKHCLVMVDMWSKWVEVFPTSKQDAATVAKALLTEIIPRWGIPRKISSDNGTHFVNEAIINGPDLVYRAWNLSDMKEAMAHLPNPDGAGDRFATELTIFCREFSPTLNELKRLLMVKLGGMNWHKVSAALPAGDRRRTHVDWSHATNDGYRAAVTGLADTVREAFPARIDISRVSCCRQEQGETVQVYYERLYGVFCKHSGLREPADRGDRPTVWESHLATSLLNGLRSEISQAVKHNYVEWTEGRVSTILKYALHAEEELRTKKERPRAKDLVAVQTTKVQSSAGQAHKGTIRLEQRRTEMGQERLLFV